ncbi:MAG TPA: NAD(P)H-hydrate dehydratase [Bacillota bacterium]|nr:NAD(P)H-hydrate dehydratase [Bacillota bacterium]
MYLVNAQQMREMDRFAMEKVGIPSIVLMEAAGLQVVNEVVRRWSPCKVLVLAGRGNNGGDAFVVARHLASRGFEVKTWFIGPVERMTTDCRVTFNAYINSKYSYEELNEENWSQFTTDVKEAGLFIDGLLGTGVNRPIQDFIGKVIGLINEQRKGSLISIDIPSGVNADTGEVYANVIVADLTITFAYPKWGQYLFPGAACCGEILVKDISIPSWVSDHFGLSAELLQADQVARWLPVRNRHSHKGTYGHVLIIGGSEEYVGAPALAAMGAIRSGSGLTTIALPHVIQPMVANRVMEAVFWPWPCENGAFAKGSWSKLADRAGQYDFTVVGPGLGQLPGCEWLTKIIHHTTGPILLDADALNLLAKDISILRGRKQVVVTPHPGEMGRLLGISTAVVEQNRPQIARDFAMENQVYVVLKGTYPIIATPEGKLFVSSRGATSLAKGGSGDVLSGMIGAMVNQTGSMEHGILLAVYIHGISGELMDEYNGTASDLTLGIGRAIRSLAEA